MPDRADSVDDVAGGQVVSLRHLGFAGRAAAERAALIQQSASRSAVNRAVHPSPAKQRFVGGVDHGVDRKRGDVGLDGLDGGSADLHWLRN